MYPSVAALRWHGRTRRPYIVSPRGMIDAWALKQARAKKWLAWHAFEQSHLARASCIHALGASEVDGIRHQPLLQLGITCKNDDLGFEAVFRPNTLGHSDFERSEGEGLNDRLADANLVGSRCCRCFKENCCQQ